MSTAERKVSKRGSQGVLVYVGDVFGYLEVQSPGPRLHRGAQSWWCTCRCGLGKLTPQIGLRNGSHVSCGRCWKRGRPTPHNRGDKHYAWKGNAAHHTTKRSRADNYNRQGECEHCGKPGYDKHHRDGNPGNNDPRNVEWLCRRCHMKADGRLERFVAFERPKKHPRPCWVCGTLRHKNRTWHGRCHACNEYIRRNPGKERSVYLLAIGRAMESS